MKLYIVRHGETEANKAGLIQGWQPGELTETGHQQAEQAAMQFDYPINAIYSSDLQRCLQTAEPFKRKYSDVPFQTDERIRERNFASVELKPKDSIPFDLYWSLRETDPVEGVESFEVYNQRVRSFVESLKTEHPDYQTVLLITHGGVISRMRDMYTDDFDYQPPQNAQLIEIEV
jgi:broad specificity phosphatase PhoE